MPNTNVLEELMLSRTKAWKPTELAQELGLQARELQLLIRKAKQDGVQIRFRCDEQTGYSFRYWIA